MLHWLLDGALLACVYAAYEIGWTKGYRKCEAKWLDAFGYYGKGWMHLMKRRIEDK